MGNGAAESRLVWVRERRLLDGRIAQTRSRPLIPSAAVFRTGALRPAIVSVVVASALMVVGGGKASAAPQTTTFSFENGESRSYDVPDGVCSLNIEVIGGQGGNGDFDGGL